MYSVRQLLLESLDICSFRSAALELSSKLGRDLWGRGSLPAEQAVVISSETQLLRQKSKNRPSDVNLCH
jgi:hypothetical protein